MEKSSRVNKYRSLRESLKEDATLPKQDIQERSDEIDDTKIPTLREYRMKQFIQEVKDYEGDQENELDGVKSELESKEIEEAIGRVRMTSGKGEQYNTRLDILNHIQSGAIKKVDKTPIVVPPAEEEAAEEVVLEPIKEAVEEKVENPIAVEPAFEEPVKHFKIFFEDEEDEEEDVKEAEPVFEEEEKEEKRSLFKHHKVFEEDETDEIEDEEELEDEEGSSVTMKVLTGMIVVLSICLVALLGYIIKLFLF
ncbi:hypothetical protein [Beduini massiliensis]|uniref:hypothetical protein n=1 Tax=Beduini massiliensis TaxID=1585974 RepID=UPI00059A86C5|nr:hypothetical protein [Beduini massiliensis]